MITNWIWRSPRTFALALLAIPLLSLSINAQTAGDLASRVRAAADGTVRFSFRARPEVCGSGNSVYVGNDNSRGSHGSSADVEWDDDCGHGPVRVVLDVHDHGVTGLRSYVGGRWRSANAAVTDLGNVDPQQAADYLLTLASDSPESVGHKAVFPATLGDGVTVWPALMKLARNVAVPGQTRRDAVFWLGQLAGETVTANLAQLVNEDTVGRAVRESAVFALSQRPNAEGIPALIRVAQTNHDPEIRKKALFWLGQSNDPRALTLFESILTGTGKNSGR